MTHLIEKQTIELRLKRTDDAFELQQRMSAFCNNQLMPALENLFNRLAPEHRHIQLDELVVDLGLVSEKNLMSKDFLEHIVRQIERSIESQIIDNQHIVIHEQETNVFRQWLYFLENGRLPWYSHGLPPNFETEIPPILARSEAAILELRHLLVQQPNALNRLIWQHKTAFLALIAGIYTGSVQAELIEIATALRNLKGRNSEETYWTLVFKRVIFQREKWAATDLIVQTLGDLLDILTENDKNIAKNAHFNKENDINPANTEGSILPILLPDNFPFLTKTEAFLRLHEPNNAWILRENLLESASKKIERLASQNPKNTEKSFETTKNKEERNKVTNTTNLEKKQDFYKRKTLNLEDSQAEMPVNMSDIPREMYVSNAGIVLLNPFLSRLFDNLRLTKEGRFRDQAMRHKALGVLHYLATGEAAVLEYNLILPKLLCQMPFNQPIAGHWVLTKKEKKECDKVLNVAIEHWSALGKTSKEGLREAFLQRKGKLINRSSGWALQVERTTIDVLIDRLPWGLGIVKLPWMRDILVVEW